MLQEQLVERAASGDHDAFTRLAREVFDRLYKLARLMVRDPDVADDAVQATLVRIWRDLPTLRDPVRFDAWSYRILLNACRDELRRGRRWTTTVQLLPTDADPRAGDAANELAARDELERAFGRLSPEHRAVLILHHFLGMPVEQVAEVVGTPLGTAKSRLHYGSKALRSALDASRQTTEARA